LPAVAQPFPKWSHPILSLLLAIIATVRRLRAVGQMPTVFDGNAAHAVRVDCASACGAALDDLDPAW
jgi:hypothetical protein